MLLLPRHVPTPHLAPPRHWSPLDKPETMADVGLVGLGLADYSPSHVLVERSAAGGRFGREALATLL